jgi:ribosome-associated heat shock protein Hsp15
MNSRGGERFSEKLAPSREEAGEQAAASAGRQRIDRWLWHARLVRTRSAAAALAAAGYVRVNGTRIVALDHAVRVLKVRGFTERRGPPSGGHELYEELT